MIIAIDASRSIDSIQKTGVEKVSDQIIQHLIKLAPENVEFVFYTPQKISWLLKDKQKILKWPVKYLWTQLRLAWEILFHPPDKVFIPVHKIPFALLLIPHCPYFYYRDLRVYLENRPLLSFPSRVKVRDGDDKNGKRECSYYLFIHDIAFKKNPKLYNFWQWLYLNFDLKMAIKRCKKIFVPTESVKKDLLKYTSVNENKVIVIHHGYKRQRNKEIKKYGEKKKQILYLGRVEEKKNISNLIRAFEIFHKKFPEYKLILAGRIAPKFKMSNVKSFGKLRTGFQMSRNNPSDSTGQANQIQPRIKYGANAKKENHNSSLIIHNSIKFLGYVSEEKKLELLAESMCLALVSKEEGFGLPILEAFDFCLPVLASDIPVLHEVGGDACFYVNPGSVEDIAIGLEKIVSDENLRLKLMEKGSGRLKDFSWQKSAQRILQEIMA